MGFYWDPASFTGAVTRLDALSGNAEDAITYVDTNLVHLQSGGLLDVVMGMHNKLASEVFASALCVPDMFTFLSTGVSRTRSLYDLAEDDATTNVDSAWKDGLERPHATSSPQLEKHAPGGRGQFGTAFPDPPYPRGDGYPITDVVNRIVDLNLVPDGPPTSPLGRQVWDWAWEYFQLEDFTLNQVPVLVGDWDAWQKAGGTLRALADYWTGMATFGRQDAGTFFLGWDGPASDQAETLFEAVFGLLGGAAPHVRRAGDCYAAHAYGVYLLADEIESLMFELIDDLRIFTGILDAYGTVSTLAVLFAHCVEILEKIAETVAKIVGRILLVARLLRAAVAIITLVVGEFASYKNEMWGYRLA